MKKSLIFLSLMLLLLVPSLSEAKSEEFIRSFGFSWVAFDSNDPKRENPCYFDPHSIKKRTANDGSGMWTVDIRLNDRKNSSTNAVRYHLFERNSSFYITFPNSTRLTGFRPKPIEKDHIAEPLLEAVKNYAEQHPSHITIIE